MITIFTSVYNRRYIIENLYQSLLRQTCFSFEWLIIDDGSTDDLWGLVEQWRKKKLPFPIIYHYVKNGGKHRAINIGVKMARGDIFFIVDSDDFLADDAVEFIINESCKIVDDKSIVGLSGLMCSYTDGRVIGGTPSFQDYVDATNLERGKYGLMGDKTCAYRTQIWRDYPLPEFEGENFLGEGIVHNKIANCGLKVRWFNRVLAYADYIEDGLTWNIFEKRRDNPLGWAANIVSNVNYVCKDKRNVLKERYLFYECMHHKFSKQEMCDLLEITETEYFSLDRKWSGLLESLDELFKTRRISSLCLYGMGMNAKRLLLYLEELQLEIQYGIDANYAQIHFQPVYSLDMELPVVDSVCITMKKWKNDLQKKIQTKLPDAYIWSLAGLDDVFK